ncbi:sugar phosphate isomerase/epimerase [bacterium]|nr:sugar phosphate isomerase/epimerase [bacterium]
MKIGAFLSSFALGVEDSLAKCKELGLDGVQLSDVRGELSIEELTESSAADCRRLVESYGLKISAVCGDIGGNQFTCESDVDERIARTKHIMNITRALGCEIVQTHIGEIPNDPDAKEWRVMQYAMDILGEYGDKIGCFLATETGPEEPALMKKFLDTIKHDLIKANNDPQNLPATFLVQHAVKHDSIKVNYDPANLVMNGFDQIGGVGILADYIVHTHAKDGIKHGGEVPLGEGAVNFPAYLKALKDIGYDGFFVIERETGPNPVDDIAMAANFLRSL